MATTNLNISVVEKRLLKQAEAAIYTGLAAKHFRAVCPVRPIALRPNDVRWDKRDLDRWIDAVKGGAEAESNDAILSKLK